MSFFSNFHHEMKTTNDLKKKVQSQQQVISGNENVHLVLSKIFSYRTVLWIGLPLGDWSLREEFIEK